MAQRQSQPLRPLTAEERAELERGARSQRERAERVARAKQLLAVADGARFTEAAQRAGRRSGDAVAHLVTRFNRLGLRALDRQQGGGPPIHYGPTERERIRREFQRAPDRERDGTATGSLPTLQRALQQAPAGLPGVSTWTILVTLWEAGYTWQQTRTWCHTGTARRKRTDGTVAEVTDPNAPPQKS